MWLVATATVLLTAAASGYAPFAPSTWSRWDSNLYLDIAQHGYTLFHCAPPVGATDEWCGNAGWFPAYPWLVGALHVVGLPLRATALAVSWIFGLAAVVVLWCTFLRSRVSLATLGGLVFFAFAPGQVFLYAIYPLSMLLFLVVVFLWLLVRSRWIAAGLVGAAAALTYPIGLLVIPVGAIWAMLVARRLRPALVVAGLALLGPVVLAVDQRMEVGRFDAYFLVQQKYDHRLQDPLGPAINALVGHHDARDLLTVFVAAVVAIALAWLVVRRPSGWALLVGLWSFGAWVLANLHANVSLTRAQAAVAPVALLVFQLPRPLLVLCVVGAVYLSVPITQLFLEGKLV